ncbi:hypothetical protein EJ03DRAFT_344732 [Teratosphaeria nubilosa]|uniref:AB hydrolase-1 domain-containing protein n=1 Tax=Teratosphaeria nubilosa TaxID=161662 RepID=A0A6G1L2K6_9PEZI|nr:hypothetical protein EJ03DRAFT_344732 [Teratosphaeria nubilosa]
MPDTDPRSSSQQSLVPSDSNQQNDRRRLLLIYIHGFMGNEMSFRSFPAHVHNLLTILLADTHVVHTKIYPRYRSRRNISFARDDFSRWLEPHEDAKTDVVLLGHSMGGLLAAEVAIMPAAPPATRPLKHRILGTVNFDVPFLGMHPGIIKSGLASIFMPSEETHEDQNSPELRPADSNNEAGPSTAGQPVSPPNRIDTLWTPSNPDPNFNPSFNNDVILPMRKGWRNAWHFVNKHSGDLKNATKALVSSHMEFGGAMANYNELKVRYARIRALEEQNDDVRKSVVRGTQMPPRVRFINYYTASTGRPKKPRIPTEPRPILGNESLDTHSTALTPTSTIYLASSLPPIPDLPDAPPPLDTSYIQDAETKKLVEKEHARAVKAYEQAVKDRQKAIRERAKLEEKREKAARKEAEKAGRSAEKAGRSAEKAEKQPHKDRRFCVLPPTDAQNQIDPCWVRVFMANVDEVGAHCGLFFVDERYERLVGDVAERVERWVWEDLGEREAALERGLGGVGLD